MTDKIVGETTAMRDRVGETTVQTGRVGETTALTMSMEEEEEGAEGTIVLRKGIERGGGTLVTKDEGYAQGPVVMEGPL